MHVRVEVFYVTYLGWVLELSNRRQEWRPHPPKTVLNFTGNPQLIIQLVHWQSFFVPHGNFSHVGSQSNFACLSNYTWCSAAIEFVSITRRSNPVIHLDHLREACLCICVSTSVFTFSINSRNAFDERFRERGRRATSSAPRRVKLKTFIGIPIVSLNIACKYVKFHMFMLRLFLLFATHRISPIFYGQVEFTCNKLAPSSWQANKAN